jgi:hypothetical protein
MMTRSFGVWWNVSLDGHGRSNYRRVVFRVCEPGSGRITVALDAGYCRLQ